MTNIQRLSNYGKISLISGLMSLLVILISLFLSFSSNNSIEFDRTIEQEGQGGILWTVWLGDVPLFIIFILYTLSLITWIASVIIKEKTYYKFVSGVGHVLVFGVLLVHLIF